MGPGCLAVFFSIFLCVGAGLLYFMVYRGYMEFRAAQSWPEVPCEVVESRLRTHHDDDGTTYSPQITYKYTWEGLEYRSDRYQISQYSSSFRKAHQKIVDAHPRGHRTVCFVNPEDPSMAILDRSQAPGLLIGLLIGGVFTLIGAGGVVGCLIFMSRRKRVEPSTHVSPAEAAMGFTPSIESSRLTGGAAFSPAGTIPASDNTSRDSGPVVLAPKQTRLMTLLIGGGLALFWNGIVSVFVGIAIYSWLDGEPQWCLSIFLIPFVVIGLALLGFVLYTFLTLFNPVPQITLRKSSLRLGETLSVEWQFRGGTSRISKLTISLVGEEVASYRQGTSTATDRNKFFHQALVETSLPADIAAGSAELVIPLNSMHSWKAPNNQVEWHVEVHGDIPFFPDIKDTFPLTIHPAELWEDA